MAITSIDDMIASNASYGMFTRLFITDQLTSTTAATTGSGYISAQRYRNQLTIPSMTTVARCYFTMVRMTNEDANTFLMSGLEVELGSLDMNTGTFTDANAMPSRRVMGAGTSAIQLATMMPMLVVTAAVTATTPTITITYTNQAGTGSRTATVVLPTSPALNSAFWCGPHLQSGDTGIQNISNMTKSAGTAGTIKLYGFMPISWDGNPVASTIATVDPLNDTLPVIGFEPSDIVAFYRFGGTTTSNLVAMLSAVGET